MEKLKHFCTCSAVDCKLHPYQHEKGCDPCIQKNLKAGEIPGCFFRLVKEDVSELKEFTIQSFADFVYKNADNKKN